MSTRLILLAHAGTRLMRKGGFPASDIGLDDGGLAKVSAYRPPAAQRVLHGVDMAMAQTAETLGLNALVVPALNDAAHGSWSGRTFEEVMASDADGFAAWIAAPAAGTPDGESLTDVRRRVGPWMDGEAQAGHTILAITSATVVRAAIAHALDIPAAATLSVDVAPLTAAEFSFNRRWRLQRLA